MGIFENMSKITKLMPFIIIIDVTSKNIKYAMEGFSSRYKALGRFMACVSLGVLTKFLVNPYYEPLSQFMIQFHIYSYVAV